MNKREKETYKGQLDAEDRVLSDLEKQYRRALRDIELKIRMLQSDELTQSRIYQIEYQKALKGQIEGILNKLHGDEYSTIQKYLSDTYTDAFVGTMYAMHGQGVPVMIPIDRNAAVKAIVTDSKLSFPLYASLGYDMDKLKKHIREEITRGIASSLPYEQIARNLASFADLPLHRANTIVRTEGHRIQQASTDDARKKAKAAGADVVKQWDASLDGATRPLHRRLDGQIREIDEPFEMGGKKAMYPGKFNDPGQDCNCRCVALTRARSALDEKELETLKERAEYFGLDKTEDFEDFKKKYLQALKHEESPAEPATPEMKEKRAAVAEYMKELGAKVDDYGMVTLYHATDKKNVPLIKKNGFRPTSAPINGVMTEVLKERVFFGHDKKWILDTWSSGGSYEIMEVKIPAEYLHQAGKNTSEVFVEGTIKQNGNIWIPDELPTSTAWDRKTIKRWNKKHGQ